MVKMAAKMAEGRWSKWPFFDIFEFLKFKMVVIWPLRPDEFAYFLNLGPFLSPKMAIFNLQPLSPGFWAVIDRSVEAKL